MHPKYVALKSVALKCRHTNLSSTTNIGIFKTNIKYLPKEGILSAKEYLKNTVTHRLCPIYAGIIFSIKWPFIENSLNSKNRIKEKFPINEHFSPVWKHKNEKARK